MVQWLAWARFHYGVCSRMAARPAFLHPFRADRHAPWEILGTQNVMTPLLLFPVPRGSQRPQHQRDEKEPWQPHHTYLHRPSRYCTAAASLPLFGAPLTPDVCIYREATQTHFFTAKEELQGEKKEIEEKPAARCSHRRVRGVTERWGKFRKERSPDQVACLRILTKRH